jgi:hypothetical protein
LNCSLSKPKIKRAKHKRTAKMRAKGSRIKIRCRAKTILGRAGH